MSLEYQRDLWIKAIAFMSFFTSVELLPEDPILNLPFLFAADKHANKVNLGIGSYQDEHGQPMVLSCVRKAQKLILEKKLNEEYLPIAGNPEFNAKIAELIFGPASQKYSTGEIATLQSVGGTGAMRVGAEMLARNRKMGIYIPDPTWPNHKPVFTYAGMSIKTYPYYDKEKHDLDFAGICDAIRNIPSPGVILLHACCHNPTGIDPTREQWQKLSDLIKKQKLIPFFDFAYQGFGEDIDSDAYPIRYFVEQGHEMFVSSSCSKNFGLYGERIGSLSVVTNDPQITRRVVSQFKQIVRGCYSMPPLQGSRIVTTILQSDELRTLWRQEVDGMRKRIKDMRRQLVQGLIEAGVDRDVQFFETQRGIFSYTGLNSAQVKRLREEFGIYTTDDGRINIAGLNPDNIQIVIEALAKVMQA